MLQVSIIINPINGFCLYGNWSQLIEFFSTYREWHLFHWDLDVPFDREKSDKGIPLRRTQCCIEKKDLAALEQWFCSLLVVYKLSISHSGLVRWKWDLTIFSKLRVLFSGGVNLPVSESTSQCLKGLVDIGWHI